MMIADNFVIYFSYRASAFAFSFGGNFAVYYDRSKLSNNVSASTNNSAIQESPSIGSIRNKIDILVQGMASDCENMCRIANEYLFFNFL